MTSDEFDPSEAAARATGDLADTDADDLEDADVQDDDVQDDEADPAPDATDDGAPDSSTGSSGLIAVYVLPLFTADPAGPTAETLQEDAGLGTTTSNLLDGALDYALHFTDELGDELRDSLGPAGKFARGLTPWFDADDADDTDGDGATGGADQEASNDVDDDGPDMGEVPGA